MDFDNRKVYGDTSITDGLVLSNFWTNCREIKSLFFMSIHLNVYQAFSSPKYFQSNWVPIVFGFQQKTIWLIVFVALHVTVIQARVWFHCVHFFCPHTTIWLIVTPKQTWTFRGKIKISLHSRCFFLSYRDIIESFWSLVQNNTATGQIYIYCVWLRLKLWRRPKPDQISRIWQGSDWPHCNQADVAVIEFGLSFFLGFSFWSQLKSGLILSV